MSELPEANTLIRKDKIGPRQPKTSVTLDYDARFLRRKRLVCADGSAILVNLPETVSVAEGDCFALGSGDLVQVRASVEEVLVLSGDLTRLAWHIGNRHTPCQIEANRLLIRPDHVLEAMVRQLGGTVARAQEPFTPEGGAYGIGRTLGHSHGGHSHGPHDPAAHSDPSHPDFHLH